MLNKKILLKLLNFWPPYLGAGIRVKYMSPDKTTIHVEMKLHWWNKNYVGTQFGGSMYAMTDPFFMLILIENLGSDYIVWDKAAAIRFKSPGRGRVFAKFHVTHEEIAAIKAQADSQDKVEPVFTIQIHDEGGKIIAEVEKVLYVRRKDKNTKIY